VISAVAFCPHPPVLVPEVAQGAAAELDTLRSACRAAITRVVRPGRQFVVLGAGPYPAWHEANARGTLAGYGVPVEVSLGSDEPGPLELPLSLTIGAWLLRAALGPGCGAVGCSLGPSGAPDPVLASAAEDPTRDFALVAMGDGSARRSVSAPGYLDERAAPFDAEVAGALAAGAGDRLSVDVGLADELLAAGSRVWNEVARLVGARTWSADLLYDDAPYGVGYLVAAWTGP